MSKHIVIIGTGLAGYTVAKEFRKLDTESSLTIITQDDGCFYSKPLLSTALAQNKLPEQLPVYDATEMSSQLNASIHTYWSVDALDLEGKQCHCKDEAGRLQTISYTQLVLANGAEKVQVPFEGDATDDVLSVNNLTDYRYFREKLVGRKCIAILGSGLVGCEFANDLIKSGHEVVLISPDQYPLKQLVPQAVGQALQSVFCDNGAVCYFERFAKQIDYCDQGYQVTLSDGLSLEADIVFSAVGIRPDSRLAKAAGIDVDKGVIVNDQLQTSHQDVYAIGDCAEYLGALKMYVAPILHGAKVLAQVLSGGESRLAYPIMPVAIKTTLHPIVLVSPAASDIGEWVIEKQDGGVKALFYNDQNQLRGFVLSGNFAKERMAMVKQMGVSG